MAMIQQYFSSTGFDCPSAYFMVGEVTYSHKLQTITISVDIFKDAQAREYGKQPMETKRYNVLGTFQKTGVSGDFEQYFSMDVIGGEGTNIMKQAYTFLKTLPEFETSLEV